MPSRSSLENDLRRVFDYPILRGLLLEVLNEQFPNPEQNLQLENIQLEENTIRDSNDFAGDGGSQPQEKAESGELTRLSIKQPSSTQRGVVLENADLVEYYENIVRDSKEQMLRLTGDVKIVIGTFKIEANLVEINLTKSELSARDELLIVDGNSDMVRGAKAVLSL